MGCARFCYILIPAFLSLVALVLSALSCAGSAQNNSFLTDIYFIDIDLSSLNATALLSSSDTSSSVSSALESLSGDSVNQDLGLSDVYSFGMWGYCKGNLKSGASLASYDTDAVDYTYCSKPKAMYVFDPAGVLAADLTDSNTTESDSTIDDAVSALSDIGISLPSGVEDYMKIAKPLCKLIFICTIVGAVLSFLQVLLSVFAVCSKAASFFAFIFSVMSFISLTLACASSTAVFVYIRKEFNNAVSDYGITANLSRNYLAFFWVAVVASALGSFFWMFSICCCSTGPSYRRRSAPPPPMDEKF